ncbi:MAG: Hsp33 family molecular chaperone HslO [Eubacteriaceae bacterium]|jgi:molecular chaperone Hsp33|nr:Hsp33 family molecular chaperone HslO [Eubacteriaceae bacterium]
MKQDRLIHGQLADYPVRFFCVNSTETVEEFRRIHQASPTAAAAGGRLVTAAILMGAMMKNERDRLTLIIKGEGPVSQIVVTAGNNGQVKGDILNPDIEVLINAAGKLDVAAAVGAGTLTVIKDTGYSEPHNSTVRLVSGEIAEDIAYYYALSEQIPTVCALGVFVDEEGVVRRAGGYILQVMPNCPEEMVVYLEQKTEKMSAITTLLKENSNPQSVIAALFDEGGFAYEINRTLQPQYVCDCSRERVESMLSALDTKELSEIMQEQTNVEVKCHFCNQTYLFDVKSIQEMIKNRQKG